MCAAIGVIINDDDDADDDKLHLLRFVVDNKLYVRLRQIHILSCKGVVYLLSEIVQ